MRVVVKAKTVKARIETVSVFGIQAKEKRSVL